MSASGVSAAAVFVTILQQAALVTSLVSGSWNDPGVWSGGIVPTSFDQVTISPGDTVTVDADAACEELFVEGAFHVTAGTMQVGSAAEHSIHLAAGSLTTIEGGTVTVTGRLGIDAAAHAITYVQSGGVVALNAGSGHSSATLASFDLGTAAATSATIAGGTIILRNAGTAASGPRDFRNGAGDQNVTGGTLQLGDAASSSAQNFRIQGFLPNLEISDAIPGHTATLLATTFVLDVTIHPGTTLALNGLRLVVSGATFTNDGTLSGAIPSSGLYFFGALPSGLRVAQTYGGIGTVIAPLAALEIENPSGVTIQSTIPQNLVATRVNLFRGTLVNSRFVTIGNGGTTSGMTQVGATGVTTGGGSYDEPPVFNAGTGGYSINYAPEGVPRTTGFEIPPTRQVASLSITNSSGVTVAGGDLTITTTLFLGAGLVHTSAGNLVRLANSMAAPPQGHALSYVNGPLAIEFNTTANANRAFAIGKGGAHRPLTLKGVNTGGVPQVYVAEVVAAPSGGTPNPPLALLDPVRYWTLSNTSSLGAAARVNLAFGVDDGVLALPSARVAASAEPSGAYTSLGGSTTGSATAGTVESTVSLTPGEAYFTVALENPPVTWDGGAATSLWEDAANWNPDGVPTSASNVALTAATPTTIEVNDDFATHDLTIGLNITLSLDASLLDVSGTFQQSGSTVQLGTGTMHVAGATTLSGGLLQVNAGTFVSGGAFTLTGGTINLGGGALEVRGGFSRSGGTYLANNGTTIFSGTGVQTIGGGVTHNHVIFRNGGDGVAKRLAAGSSFIASGDLTVESTAQLSLTAPSPTTFNVFGNFNYSAIPGGLNLGSLAVNLIGVNKVINGTESLALRSFSPSPLEMSVVVASGARYSLGDDVAIVAGRTLTVNGRLDCGTKSLNGAGALSVGGTSGTLGTATVDDEGLGATIRTTGANGYADGCIVEYNAGGDQTIHAASHPPAALIATAGGGTKSLDGDLTLTGNSGAALTKGALRVGAGTTFADGGHRLRFTTDGFANVLVEGSYLSTGSGSLSFESGADGSNIAAIDGTAFGDLLLNFASSASTIDLNASGPVNVRIRNLVCGGTEGGGTAGGTLRLNETGITNVTVTGNVSLVPVATSNSGGGFDGTMGALGRVTVLGDITSTSVAPSQPIFGSAGTNTLVMGGASPQSLALSVSASTFAGSTFEVANPSGVNLAGEGLAYTIAGALHLSNGRVSTGTNTLVLAPGAALIRTSGHIEGNLCKHVAAGSFVARTFEIGTGVDYTPLDLTFESVTTGGELTATTLAGDHPALATSDLDVARSANRFWSVTNGGVGFTTVDALLHFVPADVDSAADPAHFVVRSYDAPDWSTPSSSAVNATCVQATGITMFSDFAVGQVAAMTITATAASGGSIVPSGAVAVTRGAEMTFTIAPDSCHVLADVTVDGVSVGEVSSYTFTDVTEDHTIEATFSSLTYKITATSGPDGTISPLGVTLLDCGTNATYTVTPDSCFQVADVVVDGASVGAVTTYTFPSVGMDHTIDATFVAGPSTILASSGPGGSITPEGPVSIDCGADTTFTIAPDSCSVVADVLVDGISVGAVTSYAFLGVGANHTIEAAFAPIPYTLDVAVVGSGSVEANPDLATYPCGSTVQLTPVPAFGFAFLEWGGDASGSSVPLDLVMETNRTITATFIDVATSVVEETLPGGQSLGIWPNPSLVGSTRILYRGSSEGPVEISVFDVTGQLVRAWRSEDASADVRAIAWDGRDAHGRIVATGTYFVRMSNSAAAATTKRVVLIR